MVIYFLFFVIFLNYLTNIFEETISREHTLMTGPPRKIEILHSRYVILLGLCLVFAHGFFSTFLPSGLKLDYIVKPEKHFL